MAQCPTGSLGHLPARLPARKSAGVDAILSGSPCLDKVFSYSAHRPRAFLPRGWPRIVRSAAVQSIGTGTCGLWVAAPSRPARSSEPPIREGRAYNFEHAARGGTSCPPSLLPRGARRARRAMTHSTLGTLGSSCPSASGSTPRRSRTPSRRQFPRSAATAGARGAARIRTSPTTPRAWRADRTARGPCSSRSALCRGTIPGVIPPTRVRRRSIGY